MSDLHDLLDRAAQDFHLSPDGWGEMQRRIHMRQRRRRWASGLTAAVFALAATGFLFRAFNPPTPQVPISTPSPVPEHLRAQVTDQIDVGPAPQAIAVGEGGVWVDVPPNAIGATPEIVHVDPNSDRVVARISVPEGESDIAAGEGSVWVAKASRQGGRLVLQTLRINPATDGIVATLPDVGGQVAIGDGYLWALAVGSGDTTTVLVKIDPHTGAIISRLDLGATVGDMVTGGGFIWLSTVPDPATANLHSGTLIQVDASTVQVLRTLRLGDSDSPIFADGVLWVPICCTNNHVMLVRVDPGTGQTVGAPIDAGEGLPFAYAFGHVLLMSERGQLSDLNPTSGTIEVLATSDWPAAHGTMVLDPVSESVWVANYRRTITRIDVRDAASAEVPQLRGLTLDRARDAIEAAGLVLGQVSREPSHEEAGTVSAQSLSASSVVDAGTAVNVTISNGLPGNVLGPLDCPTQDQQARIVSSQQELNPGSPSRDVAQVLRAALLGIEATDTIDEHPSEGGAYVAISRSGRVVARLYLLSSDGTTWAVDEIATCQSSGVRLPNP